MLTPHADFALPLPIGAFYGQVEPISSNSQLPQELTTELLPQVQLGNHNGSSGLAHPVQAAQDDVHIQEELFGCLFYGSSCCEDSRTCLKP